jgi:hypothetical protein
LPPSWPSARPDAGADPHGRALCPGSRKPQDAEPAAGLEALIERQLANADKALGSAPAERGARAWSPRTTCRC